MKKYNKLSKTLNIQSLIEPILQRYIQLDLTGSFLYKDLKNKLQDKSWIETTQRTLDKVENSEAIFRVIKEINKGKNDQRVLEMFAEFDVADKLINTQFFDKFDTLEYLSPSDTKRQPDLLAKTGYVITPVEVKLLTPSDLKETKFFQKLIDKVRDHALKQLESYYKENKFENSFIFVWTHKPIDLHNIKYNDLNNWFKKEIPKPDFKVTVVCMLSNTGLWDFYL